MTAIEWSDMFHLAAYLRIMAPEVPRVVLCGTPSDVNEKLCRNLKWKAAVGLSYLPARTDPQTDQVLRAACEGKMCGGERAAGLRSVHAGVSSLTPHTQFTTMPTCTVPPPPHTCPALELRSSG